MARSKFKHKRKRHKRNLKCKQRMERKRMENIAVHPSDTSASITA